MNKKRWIVLSSVLTALLVVAALGVGSAHADSATPPAPPDDRGSPPAGALGEHPGGPRRLGPSEFEAAAKALGMTTDDVSAALKDGKTLDDLATAQGVDINAVHDAIQAAHKAQILADIDQAVTDGKMTQDKADWLILGLQNGYLDGPGPGFGRGMGPGGPHGQPGVTPRGNSATLS